MRSQEEARAHALKEHILALVRGGFADPEEATFKAAMSEFAAIRTAMIGDTASGYTAADFAAEADMLDAAMVEQAAASFVADLIREHGVREARAIVERNRGKLEPNTQAAIDMHMAGGPAVN